ncbi:MAG: M15 family metallopeptidase [Candidatus Hydrogenedentes bacterium]|nr:M15 family metallopeptidase [Candidatus Hydrogenedentota bacterium]
MKCTTYEQAVARYGAIDVVARQWPDGGQWMATFDVPDNVERGWVNSFTQKPTTRIYCNKDIHSALAQALQNLKNADLLSELKTYDGCFEIRPVRGRPGRVSTHAYGLALDINASENGLGQPPRLSAPFVKCWTDAGFDWGGDFARKDGMHFSFAWEGVP